MLWCLVLYKCLCWRELYLPVVRLLIWICTKQKAAIVVVDFSYESLLFLLQATRPEAFPHPHRLPAEGSRIGTNRPCSQVSASPRPCMMLLQLTDTQNMLFQQYQLSSSAFKLHWGVHQKILIQSIQQVYLYVIHQTVQSALHMQGNM